MLQRCASTISLESQDLYPRNLYRRASLACARQVADLQARNRALEQTSAVSNGAQAAPPLVPTGDAAVVAVRAAEAEVRAGRAEADAASLRGEFELLRGAAHGSKCSLRVVRLLKTAAADVAHTVPALGTPGNQGPLSVGPGRHEEVGADLLSAQDEAAEARAAAARLEADLEGLSSAYSHLEAHAFALEKRAREAELTSGGACLNSAA